MRLTERQRAILTAVRDLDPNAYGATISNSTGLSVPTIYSELNKMQGEYLVGNKIEPGGPERSGWHKLMWSLTPVGRAALAQSVEKK